MQNRKFSIKVENLKPRNPMGAVKMTGGGKHITSQKSLRQKDKRQIKNSFSDGQDNNDKRGSSRSLFLFV